MVIIDPQGKKDTVELILENKGDSVFRCTYRPVLEGPHTVHILFAEQEIPKSPYTVTIAEGELAVGFVNHGGTDVISWRAVSVRAIHPSQSALIFTFQGRGNTPIFDRNPAYLSFLAPSAAPPPGAPLQIVPQSVRSPPGAKAGRGAPPPKPARPS